MYVACESGIIFDLSLNSKVETQDRDLRGYTDKNGEYSISLVCTDQFENP